MSQYILEDRKECPMDQVPAIRDRTFAELIEEQRLREERAKKEEQARIEAALEAHKRSVAEMLEMPLQDKAKAQLALLTSGVVECIKFAALHFDPADDVNDPRFAARRAEIKDAALLSNASARIMDAYTRLQHGLDKQKSL